MEVKMLDEKKRTDQNYEYHDSIGRFPLKPEEAELLKKKGVRPETFIEPTKEEIQTDRE